MKKVISIILLTVFGLFVLVLGLLVFKASQSKEFTVAKGLTENQLADCGSKPNCVSTQSNRPEFQFPALSTEGIAEPMLRIEEILVQQMNGKLLKKTENYLHVEYVSGLFKFVDDLEIAFDSSKQNFQLRSESRVGRSDFGVNRKRLELLAQKWASLQKN